MLGLERGGVADLIRQSWPGWPEKLPEPHRRRRENRQKKNGKQSFPFFFCQKWRTRPAISSVGSSHSSRNTTMASGVSTAKFPTEVR